MCINMKSDFLYVTTTTSFVDPLFECVNKIYRLKVKSTILVFYSYFGENLSVNL